MIDKRKFKDVLSLESVDKMSEFCVQALKEAEVDQKDSIRIRLSLEEILESWLNSLGSTACESASGHRFGKQFIEFKVIGEKTDFQEDSKYYILSNSMLSQASLSLIYTYKNGYNCLAVYPPRKEHMSEIAKLGIAIASAIVLGPLVEFTGMKDTVALVFDPLFNTFLNVLKTISTPIIFLTVYRKNKYR